MIRLSIRTSTKISDFDDWQVSKMISLCATYFRKSEFTYFFFCLKIFQHSNMVRSRLVAIFQHVTIYALCIQEKIRNRAYGEFKNASIYYGHKYCQTPTNGVYLF